MNIFIHWTVAVCSMVAFLSGSVAYANATAAVSVDGAGKLGNGGSVEPAITFDGRFVAFTSFADNLVPGDRNGKADIFIHDRQTGKTSIISKNGKGKLGNNDSRTPAISADGRYVAFRSFADNLVAGDTNGKSDIFLHDRQTGETIIISKDNKGRLGNNESSAPAISANGRYVAFESSASNLVAGDTNGKTDIFVHDRQSGETIAVSKNGKGLLGNEGSYMPAISADGKYTAFQSSADNLVAGDTNGKADIFVHDRQAGETIVVSKDGKGVLGNNDSSAPSINADGRYVVFESTADNLAPGDTHNKLNIFVHDRQTGETTVVSKDNKGASGNNDSGAPSINADGRYVVFESGADNLVPGDGNGKSDAFVYDKQTGEMRLISADSTDNQENSDGCVIPVISGDGRYVAFESGSGNLMPGDKNGASDVFVHDLR